MLVENNHVLVGNIIMVAKDHVGGGRCWLLQIHNYPTKNIVFLHKTGPHMSVRNINRSKLYNFSPPTRSRPVQHQKKAHVEIIGKNNSRKLGGVA